MNKISDYTIELIENKVDDIESDIDSIFAHPSNTGVLNAKRKLSALKTDLETIKQINEVTE